ncbi:FUSC family protein [Marinobacterium sp. YM272]|uniref:FUSC family protein n=1 Tax=Marinobacterium sp. YM272 TaxID=3421654 RepID=UPI003D7F255D
MSTLSRDLFNLDAHRSAFLNWRLGSGSGWLYVGKVLLAMTLAYYASMILELQHTRSAALTVLIVMQPEAGQVLTKSIFRFIGTVFGLIAMLTLVALFHQQPQMFILGTALWCGICVAGAVHYRDMRAYSFLLAGYTVGMIGVPAAISPDAAVSLAVGRMLAVGLGIICGGIVSATIFPMQTAHSMRNQLASRISRLCGFARASLLGEIHRNERNARGRALAAESVSIEALRQAATVENLQLKQKNPLLKSLNRQYMALGTRLHSIGRLLEQLREDAAESETYALIVKQAEPLAEPLLELLARLEKTPPQPRDAAALLREFDLIEAAIKQTIRETRSALRAEVSDKKAMERFDTLAELLVRFSGQLHTYLTDYSQLDDEKAAPVNEQKSRFHAHTNPLYAATTGARTFLVILTVAWFWISTGWESGTMAIQSAIIASVLTSTVPNPNRMAQSMAHGAIVGSLMGFIISFFMLPYVDGFPLMMAAIAPVFILGTWLSLTPRWAGLGFGSVVVFCFVASPDNPATFLPQQFANQSLSTVIGFLMSAVLLALLFPPSGRWLHRVMLRDMRELAVKAITAPLPGLAAQLDSRSRDLLNQTYNISGGQPQQQQTALEWCCHIQEVGHAVIELRTLLRSEALKETDPDTPWRQTLDQMGRALSRLYLKPGERNFERALTQVEHSIEQLRRVLEPEHEHFSDSPRRQLLSFLHFIQVSLLDREGPFGTYLNRSGNQELPQGVAHAA